MISSVKILFYTCFTLVQEPNSHDLTTFKTVSLLKIKTSSATGFYQDFIFMLVEMLIRREVLSTCTVGKKQFHFHSCVVAISCWLLQFCVICFCFQKNVVYIFPANSGWGNQFFWSTRPKLVA